MFWSPELFTTVPINVTIYLFKHLLVGEWEKTIAVHRNDGGVI